MKLEMIEDSMMLLSFVNMKLRNNYPTLDALCEDLNWDQNKIKDRLGKCGYRYNNVNNQFIHSGSLN